MSEREVPADAKTNVATDAEQADAAYEIGYGKPPRHSRFKLGNKSGKGRRKGCRNLKTIVREAFEAKVSAKINGTTRKISKIELAAHQLANKASSGDLRAIAAALELYERHGPFEDVGTVSEEEIAYGLETLRHHFMMMGEDDDE
jgi:hypothetical protein